MTTARNDSAWESLVQANPTKAGALLSDLRKKLWVPHDGGQREVVHSATRFRILRAGRRWGKTELACHESLMAALQADDQMVWWIANNDRTVRRGYRKMLTQIPRDLLSADPPSDRANDRVLQFTNGSRIEFYTAGTPDALIGEGVNFVVVDEAATIPENIWSQRVRPTLVDANGRALIISTPRGRNWFFRLWNRGQEERHSEYESWHYTSYDNPHIPDAEIDELIATEPDIIARQEYLAEFVANAASMFTLKDEVVVEGLQPPEGWVVIGIDLAKKEDFTVIDGVNADTKLPCYFERMNSTSWPVQEDAIVEAHHMLMADSAVEGVTIGIDSTGVGDVVFDHLEDRGLDVVPINFSGGTVTQKERMVRLLASDLENKEAFIHENQRDEFQEYEYRISPNGRYQFEATSGHDDKVSAKLIQHWILNHEAPPSVQISSDVPDPVEDGLVEETIVRRDRPVDVMNRPDAWTGHDDAAFHGF